MSVYDGLDLTVDLGKRRLQHGDIGFRSFSDVSGKFQVLNRRCQTENRLLAGVYVQTPLSVMIGLSPSGHVVIFDSHAHDTDGAVLAVVQTACDWATLAAYLELTVGKISDAQLVLLGSDRALTGLIEEVIFFFTWMWCRNFARGIPRILTGQCSVG